MSMGGAAVARSSFLVIIFSKLSFRSIPALIDKVIDLWHGNVLKPEASALLPDDCKMKQKGTFQQ